MASFEQETKGITDEDRRNLDFMQLLIRISDALSKKETADVKLYCMYLIPGGRLQKLKRPVEVFVKLKELGKIDQENLDFVEELLERMGRQDLIRDVLRPAQRPDREVPENPELQPPETPELQPGRSQEGASDDETTTSNIYTVVHGHSGMTHETVDRHRQNIASACNTRRSQVKFRGYKKDKSILVHFSIPRQNTAVLRHMADHSDPRLVYMGMKSLQIDAEVPIKVQQGALFYDVKRQLPVDDIEVGSTRTKHQRAPKSWTRLSALNLFSEALPLHLQAAASLEYQGFSYSLVRALLQKDRVREHQMRQAIRNLRNAEVDSNTLRQKAEVDSNTIMTLRSKLNITENRLKEALETIAILEEKLQQAQEYAEKAAKQVTMTARVAEYRGEKTHGDWSVLEKRADAATRALLASTGGTTSDVEKSTEVASHVDSGTEATEQERPVEGGKEAAEDFRHGVITFGGQGSEPGKFWYPRGVVVSPGNEIFLSDTNNNRVQVHSIEGVYLRHFPTVVPGTENKQMLPFDVCMGANDTLWVSGRGETVDHVVQYSTDGTAMTRFDLKKITPYRGIAANMRTNHILVTGYKGEVQVFRPDGSLVQGVRHPENEMTGVGYIAVDGEGNILMSDWDTNSVYVYDRSGEFLFMFGGEGSGVGQLKRPNGICADSSGDILVADSGNKRIQIFTRRGEFVRTVPTGFEMEGLNVGPEGQLVVTNWRDDTLTIFPMY
ncbi:uncharacterized protein LOC144867667 [Branchiostoma floridae x Branchiostoma japonicum]